MASRRLFLPRVGLRLRTVLVRNPLVLLPLLALLAPACSRPASGVAAELALAEDAPVVMVVVDTLAASHLGFYGATHDTSPYLDELAESAFVFDGHTTQANATFPSMTSTLTGLYPRTHKSFLEIPIDGEATGVETSSIAERFRARGYYTIAIWSHPFWQTGTGASVGRGWDVHSVIGDDVGVDDRIAHANAAYTNERLFAALATYRREGAGKPLFLWLHYFDPHTPYTPPEEERDLFLAAELATAGLEHLALELTNVPYESRLAWLGRRLEQKKALHAMRLNRRALYDAEIRAMDRELRAATARLADEGLWDEALLIFLADHGENMTFGGHQELMFTHAGLFEDVVKTPLLIRFPHQVAGRRVSGLSQNIDLLPTLVDLFELSAEPLTEGASLLPYLADPNGKVHDQTFVESRDNVEKSVRTAELKLIDAGVDAAPLLYEWRTDVDEEHSLTHRVAPKVVEGLAALLDQFVPEDVVAARIPRGIALRIEIPDSPIAAVDGPGTRDVEGGAFALPADAAPAAGHTEARLHVRRLRSRIEFELTRPEGAPIDPAADVYAGQTPLARTTLIPDFLPADAPPPSDAVLRLRHLPAGGLRIHVSPDAPADLRVELRFADPKYGMRLSVVDGSGFGPLTREEHAVRAWVLEARAEEPVWVELASTAPDAELLALVRIDGAWPPLDRIAVDGRAVDASRLRFVAPEPVDARVTAALLAGPPNPLPPGAVGLWIDGSSQRVHVDNTLLAPDVLGELQKLGYAR